MEKKKSERPARVKRNMSPIIWPKAIDQERIQKKVLLAPYTTMGVGGPADYFFVPENKTELREVLLSSQAAELPYLVLGGGSNLIFNDAGFRGLVIYLRPEFHDFYLLSESESRKFLSDCPVSDIRLACDSSEAVLHFDNKKHRILYADAGVVTKALSLFAARESLSGLEFACGIPGTIGGALFMNAGAYGSSMADVSLAADYLSKDGQFARSYAQAQKFSYRNSIYREAKHIVCGAYFILETDDVSQIQARMDGFNERRISTQPLELPSAGSVFKRPEGYFAGKLIMDAGLKGKRIGGAEVSTKHAGFIVNVDHAGAEDIKALVEFVQAEVLARFGVMLEPEIRVLDEYGKNLFH